MEEALVCAEANENAIANFQLLNTDDFTVSFIKFTLKLPILKRMPRFGSSNPVEIIAFR